MTMRPSPLAEVGITAHPLPAPEPDQELVALVRDACAGDELAWERIYARFTPLMRGIARSYRLSASDVEDALQTAWLRLLDNVGRIREPAAVGAWLTVTTRRECLQLLRAADRECPSDDPALGEVVECTAWADPEGILLATERRATLRRALAMLPERQRELMTLLTSDASMDYCTVGATLEMPVGSIGPTRARILARLRAHPQLHDLCRSSC